MLILLFLIFTLPSKASQPLHLEYYGEGYITQDEILGQTHQLFYGKRSQYKVNPTAVLGAELAHDPEFSSQLQNYSSIFLSPAIRFFIPYTQFRLEGRLFQTVGEDTERGIDWRAIAASSFQLPFSKASSSNGFSLPIYAELLYTSRDDNNVIGSLIAKPQYLFHLNSHFSLGPRFETKLHYDTVGHYYYRMLALRPSLFLSWKNIFHLQAGYEQRFIFDEAKDEPAPSDRYGFPYLLLVASKIF